MVRLPTWVNPDGPLRTVRQYYGIFLLSVTVFVVLRGLWDVFTLGRTTVFAFYFAIVFPGLFGLYFAIWLWDVFAVR